jgi:hypothetical protein
MSDNNEQSTSITDSTNQRASRARAFKLKKWILNIESSSTKTPAMEAKLDEYYTELKELQDSRGGFNRHTAATIIKTTSTTLKENGRYW